MLAGVPKETFPGERRVAVIPAVLPSLTKLGIDVLLEAGAGEAAGFPDEGYVEKGARVAATRAEVFAAAEAILQVRSLASSPTAPPPKLDLIRPGQVVVGFLDPIGAPQGIKAVADRGAIAFALDLIPRITRAQAMDALSSMATIIGYKAVLLAADTTPRMFPMLMTAGGTLAPARVFIIGAGVAGLQAIATARRLGAVVSAFDVRPVVKEQVQSLGATFVEAPVAAEGAGGYASELAEDQQRRVLEAVAKHIVNQDLVVTTAQIPGRAAPRLVTAEMVRAMKPGSVIVDLAAETGGNCELTRAGDAVDVEGVLVLGPVNLASTVAFHASQTYSRNLQSLLQHLLQQSGEHPGRPNIDLADEITGAMVVTHAGEIRNR
jgi:NAD(P) transhydrogenase subunit alpha